MATILDKDLTRETSVKFDNREVVITLTEDQRISMKLKGMKSGEVSIGIDELYQQLNPNTNVDNKNKPIVIKHIDKGSKGHTDMLSISELRSKLAIDTFDYAVKARIDSIMVELLKENQK